MTPYTRILALLCLFGGGLAGGWRLGADHVRAGQADIADAIKRTEDAAQLGVAKAISEIQIKHQTIIRKAEHEIAKNPAMADCRIGAGALGLLNSAAGYDEPEPAGGGDVSASAVAP